jgi:hypothetical protein
MAKRRNAMRQTIMALVVAAGLAVVPAASGHPYNMPLGQGKRAIRHAVRRIAENTNGVRSWSVSACRPVRHSHVSCMGRWQFPGGSACTRTMIAHYPNSSSEIKVYGKAWHCPR